MYLKSKREAGETDTVRQNVGNRVRMEVDYEDDSASRIGEFPNLAEALKLLKPFLTF